MIGLDSGQPLVFDFVTQQDLPQEIGRFPSCTSLNGEYCIVGYGENLPHVIAQNAVGAWVNNYYEQTDHSTYTVKEQLRFKCKGRLKRDSLASIVKWRVRLLKQGVPTGISKAGEFQGLNSASSFDISTYLWYPQTFIFNSVRLDNGANYSAQIKFEEWVGSSKIGETIWFSTGHTVKIAIKAPSLSVALGQPIYTNNPTLRVEGIIHGNYPYVGMRKDLAYGTGAAGAVFSANGSDLDITIPTSDRKYGFDISSYGNKKMRIAIAAKDAYGNVMTRPAIRDVCFDFEAPALSWSDVTQSGSVLTVEVKATDVWSGVDAATCVAKNVSHGVTKAATFLGQDTYTVDIPVIEGQNVITFTAADRAGNSRTIDRIVLIDTTKPTVVCKEVVGKDSANATKTLSFVDGMRVYGNSITARFLAQDATTGLQEVILAHNGMIYGFDYQGEQAVVCEQVFTLIEGNNVIAWQATDKQGNVNNGESVIRYAPYNAGGPALTVVSPIFNSWQTNGCLCEGTVNDADGVDGVRVDVALNDGGLPYKSFLTTVTGNSWSCEMNNLVDGTAYLTIVAKDLKGVENSLKHKIRVDNVSPEVTVVGTVPSMTNQSNFSLKTYAEEPTSYLSNYKLIVNGVEKVNHVFQGTTQSNKLQPRTDVVALSQGTNTISVVYTDATGNQGQKDFSIERVNLAVNISVTPSEGTHISEQMFDFVVAATSQEQIQQVLVDYLPNKTSEQARIDGAGFYRLAASTINSVLWQNSFMLSAGTPCINVAGSYGSRVLSEHFPVANYTMRITAVTALGNTEAFFGYTMDTAADLPRVISITPADGASGVSASVPIKIVFSKPMNTTVALQFISINPQPQGEWYWSQGNTVAEFIHTQTFQSNVVYIEVNSAAKDIYSRNLVTSYFSSFSVNQLPFVESVLPSNGAGLDSVVEVRFSTRMLLTSLDFVGLKTVSGASINCDYSNFEDNGKTVLRLRPQVLLTYSTNYIVTVPSSVTSVYGQNISEHRHSFTTRMAGSVTEMQGATVLLLPGLNGVSLPMENAEIYDEKTLRSYIDKQLGTGSTGTIFRYDTQLKKWTAKIGNTSGKTFLFGESVVVAMNIDTAKTVRFIGSAHPNGKNIVISAGLNCISLPRQVQGLNRVKDMAAHIASQLGLSQLPVYLIRKKAGSSSKMAVGYAYRLPVTHEGLYLETADEDIRGDAIIIVSPKSGFVKFSGDSWEN